MIYGQLIINLCFVILLIVGYFYLVNYINKRKYKGGKQIELLETLALSNKEKIILVKAREKTLLIGITQNQVNLLTDFNKTVHDIESWDDVELKEILQN